MNANGLISEWKSIGEKSRLRSLRGFERYGLVTSMAHRMGGATQIGSKRAMLVKLIDGLTSSRVLTTFAVATWIVQRADST